MFERFYPSSLFISESYLTLPFPKQSQNFLASAYGGGGSKNNWTGRPKGGRGRLIEMSWLVKVSRYSFFWTENFNGVIVLELVSFL